MVKFFNASFWHNSSTYGNSPEFIDAIEGCVGTIYFVSIPANTLCWLQRPITRKKQYEVRKYPGWNHHILTCMLAHFSFGT